MHLQFARHRVTRHHPAGHTVHGDQLEHVAAGQQRHPSQLHLAHQCLVSPIEQLLAGLTAGIEGAAHQGPAEAAGGQAAAVFTRERHPLGDALIDDAAADLRQPLATGFPGAEVSSFKSVSEQAADTVAIHGHWPCGIDTALSGHRMSSPWAVVEAEHRDPIALLGQGCCSGGTGEPGAHHQHIQLAFAQRTDQWQAFPGASPGIGNRPSWKTGIWQAAHAAPPKATPRLIIRKPALIRAASNRPPRRSIWPLAGVSQPRLRCAASAPWSRCKPMATLPSA